MAQSIRNIIQGINTQLEGVFKGSKLYGVATLVEREGRSQPIVDEKPVSYDDSYALQMYHKLLGIDVRYDGGYGRVQDTINTYNVSAVLFNNEKITKLKSDQIAIIIQSVLASNDNATLNGIILNSQQVFATEYRGIPYALNEYQSLMQINYTVEITYQGNCFNLCPEDFLQCASS